MVKQQTIQFEDGGSIPTSPLQLYVKECRFKEIAHIFEAYHYKGRHMGGGINWCLAATYHGQNLAGAVMGKARHDAKYSEHLKCVEIRRMACIDALPKNSESWFLAKIMWWLKKNTDIKE